LIFLLLLLCAWAFFSYVTEGCEPFNFRRILATALIVIYGLIYFYVPPFLGLPNARVGRLFELLPLYFYVNVLYTDEYPNQKEKIIIWFSCIGWAIVFLILLYFKISVW